MPPQHRARPAQRSRWFLLAVVALALPVVATSFVQASPASRHAPQVARAAHGVLQDVAARSLRDDALAEASQQERAPAASPALAAPYVAQAGMALRDGQHRLAEQHLQHALAIDPLDLDALSLRGALSFLAGDRVGFAQAQRAVLDREDARARFFEGVAGYIEGTHRYEDLVELARAALENDASDVQARTLLGLNLLRTGDEAQGLVELRAVSASGHRDTRVENTLHLYDTVIKDEYETLQAPPFVIRVHRDERAALEPYLVPLLQRAHARMQQRYAFTPKGPLFVELYASAEHFSLRTTGLPHAAVQGVCFGSVVTGVSPAAGSYNWGQIVWHELSHAFHLQLSQHRVPRWFTEGLAEYETQLARPEWKREDDYLLWRALRDDRLPSLGTLNRAFSHARKSDELMTAYYAASRAVAYIVERFGEAKLHPMLVGWGQGKTTEAVVHDVLGVSLDELDRAFVARERTRLSHYAQRFTVDLVDHGNLAALIDTARRAPDDADAQSAVALAALLEGKLELAHEKAHTGLRLSKGHALARFVLARVALARGDSGASERLLRSMVAERDGYLPRLMLAQHALSRGDLASAVRETFAAIAAEPDRADAWHALLRMAEVQQDAALSLRASRAIAGLDQHDRSAAATYLSLLVAAEDWREVVRAGESALYLDPHSPALHAALGRAYAALRSPERALFELDRALATGYRQAGVLQLARAHALSQLGDAPGARRAAQLARAPELRVAARGSQRAPAPP